MSRKMTEALKVLANHGRLLREQSESILDNDHPADVEAAEEVWGGGDNIELPIDIAHVIHGADEQVTEPETLTIAELHKIIAAGLLLKEMQQDKSVHMLVKKHASAGKSINQDIADAMQEDPAVDPAALEMAMEDYYDEMMGF